MPPKHKHPLRFYPPVQGFSPPPPPFKPKPMRPVDEALGKAIYLIDNPVVEHIELLLRDAGADCNAFYSPAFDTIFNLVVSRTMCARAHRQRQSADELEAFEDRVKQNYEIGLRLIRLCLQYGAIPGVTEKQNQQSNALHTVIAFSNWDKDMAMKVVQIMIQEAREPVNLDELMCSNTLIHLCARNDNLQLMHFFFDRMKIDNVVNQCNLKFWAPLHFAAQATASKDLFQFLLERGADPLAENATRQTPRQILQKNINLLRDFGGPSQERVLAAERDVLPLLIAAETEQRRKDQLLQNNTEIEVNHDQDRNAEQTKKSKKEIKGIGTMKNKGTK